MAGDEFGDEVSAWIAILFPDSLVKNPPAMPAADVNNGIRHRSLRGPAVGQKEPPTGKGCISNVNTKFPWLNARTKYFDVKKLGPRIIERLEKRKKIADAIIEAEKEGLYELAEHHTGMLKI